MEKYPATLNAKVAATTLLLGAISLHLVNQLDYSILPIRLLILGVLVMGAWSFSDEMGIIKPLNRAAFICFIFSMCALAVTMLNPSVANIGKYYLIYALMLLFSVLIWSAAFLHRQKSLKVIGALSAVASLLPIVIIVAGHVSVGAAGFFGVSVLLNAGNDAAILGSTPVNIIEAVFVAWAVITAVFLLYGQMTARPTESSR